MLYFAAKFQWEFRCFSFIEGTRTEHGLPPVATYIHQEAGVRGCQLANDKREMKASNIETENVLQATGLTGQVNSQARTVADIVGEAVNKPTADEQGRMERRGVLAAMRVASTTKSCSRSGSRPPTRSRRSAWTMPSKSSATMEAASAANSSRIFCQRNQSWHIALHLLSSRSRLERLSSKSMV